MVLSDRDIVSTRIFRFPRALVFRAWTEPEPLARWWGPKGFTNTFEAFELRPGGEWRFVMHAPDGASFANRCVFVEIAPPARLVFDHIEPVHAFRVTATFAERDGGTEVVFRMTFAAAEECARVRSFIVEANEQNFDRLEAELGRMSGIIGR